MEPPREMHSSVSAPEEIYKALEGTVLPYQLPGVGGRGRSIRLQSRTGTPHSSNTASSTSYGPPSLRLAIPGSSRLRSASDAAIQFRDPFAPSSSSSSSSNQRVPWRSASTRSAPHRAVAPRYIPYAPPPRRAATAPTAATVPPFQRRTAAAPGVATRKAPAYAPGEHALVDGYESSGSGFDAHAHRRACSHESGLGLTLPPTLRAARGRPPPSVQANSPAGSGVTSQLAKARYFAARDAGEPLDTIPQSPGLAWQVTRVGEDEDEHVVVVERGGEKLFVVNADEEREEWWSKPASAADSSLITMALLPDGTDALVARPRSTDPAVAADSLHSTLRPAAEAAARGWAVSSDARSESLFSILAPPVDGDEASAHSSSRSGSTSSARPETAVQVKRRPVAGSLTANVDKALPALPLDLMPSPLFSSTAAVLRAMEDEDDDDDDYFAAAGAAYGDGAEEDATPMPRPLPPVRSDFDWTDVVLSRFSIASQDAPDRETRDGHERPQHEPGRYAESSEADDDTDGASLAGRSSDAGEADGDGDDAASASTFSAAPSGAASASASPRAAGGPVRKPSARQLRGPAPAAGGARGKGRAAGADAGLETARQAVAQMQLLLHEFEYLGAALI